MTAYEKLFRNKYKRDTNVKRTGYTLIINDFF